ncbi:MAG: DRTGG domain-containing protein [Prolixibacteraceae bacterium]|jgi:predicted transcriptional regulator|nr:DRTGG domain-containing protein [Prolixibacteraceae bacterium]
MILTYGGDTMKVSELTKDLNLVVFSGSKGLIRNITGGYISDLLSDVLENASHGKVWITLQTHANIVDIAVRKELACILLVSSLTPEQTAIDLSNKVNIPVLGTSMSTFEIAGLLYQKIKGVQ